VAHAKSDSSFGSQCCFRIHHAASNKRDGARVFSLGTLIRWCRFSDGRLQVRHWNAAKLIVIADATIDRKEHGALEQQMHNDTVTALPEQSLKPTPSWFFQCPYMTVW
jgi:hypothetical protein